MSYSQEQKTRIPMITVYSNNFFWRKKQGSVTLVAKLEMGSFQAVKKVMLISSDKCGRPLIFPRLVVAKKPKFTEIFFGNPRPSFFGDKKSETSFN